MKIKVFSTPHCGWCVQLKKYLNDQKIEFEEIDVTEKDEWLPKMFERSHHMGVPQMWIGDKTIVGYDIDRINQLLGINNK